MSFETGYISYLTVKLTSTGTSMTVATPPTVTSGRLLAKQGNTKEWISFTGVSGNTITGLTRGLSKTADPSTAGTGLEWPAGTVITLVAMHDQLVDKQDTVTFKDINFAGTTTGGLKVKSLTTTQRTALTASNGMIVYDSSLGELYQYIAGAWNAISAGSTQSNASLTLAGKVELATDAEITAGTVIGGTGASLVVTPEQLNKSISLKGAGIIFGDTDEIVVNISGLDYRITGANLRESIAASTTQKGTVELSTDAEVIAGTDIVRYVNPKQIKDNYMQVILSKNIITSDTLQWSADTERTTASSSYAKLKEIQINEKGTIRVKFDLKEDTGGDGRGRIYVNGVAVGTERLGTTTYATWSEDISVNARDLVQIYAIQSVTGVTYIKNCRIYYTIDIQPIGVVNTD